jgi:hypothetical protein
MLPPVERARDFPSEREWRPRRDNHPIDADHGQQPSKTPAGTPDEARQLGLEFEAAKVAHGEELPHTRSWRPGAASLQSQDLVSRGRPTNTAGTVPHATNDSKHGGSRQ